MVRWSVVIRMVALAVVCSAAVLASAGSAAAAPQAETGYSVTYVARECPSFTDIFANRARNDIQESLKDLGPDSPYTSSDFRVSPTVEERAPQNVCKPLPNWRFTLGTGFQSRADNGPWGSLSKVTGAYDTAIRTKDSTPLLDATGQQIADRTIAGAVTVELTDAERHQASSPSSLWLEGGVPGDPVLTEDFPGPEFAFGALRCAVDALNGDNVEYVFFPAGVTHVFCYALYVSPPPTAGTITIEKRVTGAPAGDHPAFPFNGSISFDPSGFVLGDGQSEDFPRAGGATWEVTEGKVDGYALSSVNCTAVGEDGGPPSSTFTVIGATTAIHLVAGEHVTCVYTNRYVPPQGGVTIRKITLGGVGSFGYTISGGGQTHTAKATTTEARVPVDADPSPLSLDPGTYTIRERRPSSNHGTWRLVAVTCNGAAVNHHRIRVTVSAGQGSECTFVNAFRPAGAISLSKLTEGGTGTTKFVVSAATRAGTQYFQSATTTHEGVPVDAKPSGPADGTDHLPLGTYTIVEQPPTSSESGSWQLNQVICNGLVEPFAQGAVIIRLTDDQPSADCQFANLFTDTPLPTPFPEPPSGGGVDPVDPTTDISVTKTASPKMVHVGQVITYKITVRNVSKVTAARVVASDQTLIHDAHVLTIHNPAGTCRRTPHITCQLGTMKPGAKVVITVRSVATTPAKKFVNRVAVGTATNELTLANNTAHATVRVLPVVVPVIGRG
jgi:Domain of unknown function DUF11